MKIKKHVKQGTKKDILGRSTLGAKDHRFNAKYKNQRKEINIGESFEILLQTMQLVDLKIVFLIT